jgi:predicted transcriptional regulator
MRPSEKIAQKISLILESNDLFRRINIFDWSFNFSMDRKNLQEDTNLSSFESHLQEVLNDIGICSYWSKKGSIPFKLSLYSKSVDENKESSVYPLFSGVSEEDKKFNELSFRCLKMFTELFQKNSLFIVNNEIKIPDSLKKIKIPIIRIRNLEKIDDEEEFVELIQESGN